MKKKLLLTAILAFTGSSIAQEKTLSLKLSQPLELYGGLTGGYFFTTNEGGKDSQDAFKLTNALIGLKSSEGIVGFDLAVGSFLAPSVWDGGVNNSMVSYTQGEPTYDEAGILWGYATLSPIDKLSLKLGYIPTNIGAEVINTYANKSITLGAVWFAQPVIYPGVRVSYEVFKDIKLYAEYNHDSVSPRREAFAFGSLGSISGISYALSYYDYTGFKNLIDLVLGYSIGDIELGLNADYQWLDSSAKTPGQDDSAYGLAVYITPKLGILSIPVRLEYFNEGTSGIYWGGADKGYTVTVTPTFKPSENTFIRGEVAYISTDNKVFKNGTEDNKTTLAVELGFTF
ncbi:putative OmpL-like beta-barrel porin-2 [Hydrogenivirga caldilitoris]|uniref:Putative OmpL-like beta-barrel porin-2 n=1 Tax=Hydrogenivirga caldilitoris TaxID=246264 RepID=A0A497XSV8_9AQUI|nr:outer membrane beta-barrel protein [Hydrogenivirga caldilitoris]RLJ70212.1 putative OmpL-like beta-barrel porin-2 [Hydrogenivirga caldilitoris]